MKILITGYYNRNNYGDDMYHYAFPKIFKNQEITFIDINKLPQLKQSNIDFDLIILGGGDVMTPFFLNIFNKWYYENNLESIPCHSYSMGIPYLSILESGEMDIFDFFVCRNKADTKLLKKRYGDKHAIYLPDFVFIEQVTKINKFTLLSRTKNTNTNPIVSIFLAKPCINDVILNKLANFINKYDTKYNFIAYPLNTNKNNINENDYSQSIELHRKAPKLNIISDKLDFDKIIYLFKKSYFSICVRLHAHIFSIIAETPFISIYSTRKVRNLLDDFELNKLGTPLILECTYCNQKIQPPNTGFSENLETVENGCGSCRQMCGKPVDINENELEEIHQNVIKNHSEISKSLQVIKSDNYLNLCKGSEIIPNTIKRRTLPYYLNSRMIDDKRNKILDSITHYLYQNFSIDYDVSRKVINGDVKIKDLIGEINIMKQKKLEKEITDLICWMTSGNISSDFHYGLLNQIGTCNYNLTESLNYLIKEENKKAKLERVINNDSKFDMFKINQEKLKNVHYSGWDYVVSGMYSRLDNPKGIMMNGFIDKTFHWEYDFNTKLGIIPYKERWTGFLHHALNKEYSIYNCHELFKKNNFLESLKTCVGIYVFSDYLASWLRKTLKNYGFFNIIVEKLVHPTKTPSITFNYLKFLNNNDRSVVQIGGWYRNPYSIYELDVSNTNENSKPKLISLNKKVLKGKNMDNYFKPTNFNFKDIIDLDISVPSENKTCGIIDISDNLKYTTTNDISNKYIKGMINMLDRKHKSVDILEHLDNLEFDILLSQNIVFLELVDCSVSNTVLECLIRNTPLLINKHPAIVELLGECYPFYYTDLIDAGVMVNNTELIYKTHIYMKKMEKTNLNIDYFIQSIIDSKIYKII
jgi:hypothetical protein